MLSCRDTHEADEEADEEALLYDPLVLRGSIGAAGGTAPPSLPVSLYPEEDDDDDDDADAEVLVDRGMDGGFTTGSGAL